MKTHVYAGLLIAVATMVSCTSNKTAANSQSSNPGNVQGNSMLESLNLQSPASLAGKTISFEFSANAGESCVYQFTSRINPFKGKARDEGDGNYVAYSIRNGKDATSYNYQKTGSRTARISMPGYEWDADYNLFFETPTSGTVEYVSEGEGETTRVNGRFIIK